MPTLAVEPDRISFNICMTACDLPLSNVVLGSWVHEVHGGTIPKGPKVVRFGGSYVEFYKVIPKRNYFGAFG